MLYQAADVNAAALDVVRTPATLRQQVSEALRTAIEETRFLPGQRLIERELCEMAGVSRPLIREVLRELEADGLVEISPRRGPIVAGPLSVTEARSVYETRAVLEALAGQLFAERASSNERTALREACVALEPLYARINGDPTAAIKPTALFYKILFAGAHNSVLPSLLRNLHGRISQLRSLTMSSPGRATLSLAELRAIVDAVDRRDAQAASDACRKHVENAAEIAYTLLQKLPLKGPDESRDR